MNTMERKRLSACIRIGQPIFEKYYQPGEHDEYRLFHAEEMIELIKKANLCDETRKEYVNVIVAYMYLFTSQKQRFNDEIRPVYTKYLNSLKITPNTG